MTVPVPAAHEAPHAPETVAGIALGLGFDAEAASGVEAALDRLEQAAPGPKRVLICGSLYLAGHVLALQEGVVAQPN